MLKTLVKLISFKTVTGINNQNNVLQLYKYVNSVIDKSKYKSKIINVHGFNSMIVEPKKSNHRLINVLLLAHIDVVPGEGVMFKAKVTKTKIIGRGASDMKFAVAVFLKLLRNVDPNLVNVRIVLTSDEEVGGVNGVGALNERGLFKKSDIIIIPDGGDNFKIVSEEKGVIHLKVTSSGKPAHGSRPWKGSNAILSIFNGYTKLEKHFDNSGKNWSKTLSLGKLNGGTATNVVPDSAEMHLDIRYIHSDSKDNIMKKVRDAFEYCSVTTVVTGVPFKAKLNNVYFEKLKKSFKKFNKKVVFIQDHGASDARFLENNQVPVFMFKPKSGGHHTNNEWVDIKSLETYYKILEDFLFSLK